MYLHTPLPSTGSRSRDVSFQLRWAFSQLALGFFACGDADSQGLPRPLRRFGKLTASLRSGADDLLVWRWVSGVEPPPPVALPLGAQQQGAADVAGKRRRQDLRTRLQAETAWRRGRGAVVSGKWKIHSSIVNAGPTLLSCGVSRRG